MVFKEPVVIEVYMHF